FASGAGERSRSRRSPSTNQEPTMTHVRQLGPPVLVLIAACAPPLLEPPPRTSTIEEHASFYACRDGVDLCGAPVIGVPDQIICGADATSYQCQFDGWHWRPDLGACTQTCDGDTSYHCAPRARGNVCGEP